MATGTALQPQKKSKQSHYRLAGVLILAALVLGWVLGGGSKAEESDAYVVGLEGLHSIQPPEDAVFHSRERLFQPPLERADAGPRPWI